MALRGTALALLGAFVLGTAGVAVAQTPLREGPGLEQQRFRDPEPPRAAPRGPAIELRGTQAPEEAERVRLRIRRVVVEGSTVYSPADLAPLYADLVGPEVTLKAVYDIAQRITARYGADGYVLSRAIVPPQSFAPGGAVVRIRVVEGYVDRVQWPASLGRYRDFFSYWGSRITADRPANIRSIERYLLLGNDLPGLKLRSTLKPSDGNTGAATLIVEVDHKPVDLQARVDNRGTEARGPYQYLTGTAFNNLLGLHEQVAVTYAGTFQTRELQYVAGQYRQMLTAEGLTALGSIGYSTGKPGTQTLRQLTFETESLLWDVGLSYPLIRSREQNLTVTALFFSTDAEGVSGTLPNVPSLNSKDRLRGARLRVDYDVADRFSGITQVSATASFGIDGLGSTSNSNLFASRAGGRVDFKKIEASIARLQPLAFGFFAFLAAEAQVAEDALLASEECTYGGRTMGRAFDPSELTGDRCWAASAELRYDLPIPNNPLSRTQLYGFVDHGRVYREIAVAGRPKEQDGTSAGVGLRLVWKENVFIDLTAAKPLDGRADDEWRWFFAVAARY